MGGRNEVLSAAREGQPYCRFLSGKGSCVRTGMHWGREKSDSTLYRRRPDHSKSKEEKEGELEEKEGELEV